MSNQRTGLSSNPLYESFMRLPEESSAKPAPDGDASGAKAESGAAPSAAKPPEPSEEKSDAYTPAPIPKAIWCSDCRAVMRQHYFALDDRPVCGNCRQKYHKAIARGTGSNAMWRAVGFGFGAAVGCALLLGVMISYVGFVRLVSVIGVGYAVAKAINYATGGYPGRKYQILAVALTYFGVGLGFTAPVIKAAYDVRAEVQAEIEKAAAAPAPNDSLAQDDTEVAELADEYEALAKSEEQLVLEEVERIKNGNTASTAADAVAAGARPKGVVAMLVGFAVALVTLPLISLLAYGIYGAVVSLGAMGYGMYKAWDMTGDGPSWTLRGPFRVGTGPIPHTL